MLLLAVIFLLNGSVGFTHYSVQKGYIADPCKVKKISTIEDFNEMLGNNEGCKSQKFTIFGLSTSLVSGILSILMVIYILFDFLRFKNKNKLFNI